MYAKKTYQAWIQDLVLFVFLLWDGYLCTFQVYHGASRDLVTGWKVPERGLAKRVVGNLVAPFVGVNHVLYCDNF